MNVPQPEAPAVRSTLGAMVEAVGGAQDADWLWLEASWQEPEPFFRALWARADAASEVPLSSELGTRYDLFQAVIGRFQGVRPALSAISWPRKHGGFLKTDYAQLAHLAGVTHSYWASLGVEPGSSLCIVCEPGPELALALAAALRAGLVISVVSPTRRTYLRNRLSALEPDHVLADPQLAPWLGRFAERSLNLMDPRARLPAVLPDSYAYAAGDPVLRAFSPYSRETLLPYELSADDLFKGLLRDAQLIWPVLRRDRVTVFADPVLTQPNALLTTWFGGGEFVFLSHEWLTKEARRLAPGQSPNVWLLDAQARDLLLEEGMLDHVGVDRWFRDPAEPSEQEPWRQLAQRLAEKGARGANLLQAAACGGSLLFSARGPVPELFDVLPVPGRPWQLEDLNGSGEPAVSAAGAYAPQDVCSDGRAGRFVLSRLGEIYRLSGAPDTWRAGVFYPADEVAALLTRRGQAEAVTAVMVPSSARMHDADALLVVFVDPRWAEALEARAAAWTAEIERLIEDQLGPSARPDRVSLIPLLPQYDEAGAVDRDWARRQVLGNVLTHKAHRPVFVALAALSRTLALVADELAKAPTDTADQAEVRA